MDPDIPGIRPYFEVDEEGLQTIAGLLASGQITNNGRHVQEFEKSLADYLGVKETVAVSSGSDALLLALKALSLPSGRVILPAYTYIATLNAVVQAGFEPVFCEIEGGSFTLDVGHLAELLAQQTAVRCVLPVNVFGVPADLLAIRELCDRAGAKLLYDNAHGFGTEASGLRIPREPDVQAFSFHATKTLPAVEGGLIVSDNPDIIALTSRLRCHGLAPVAADARPGFNAKMDEIRAVIGRNSLRHFPETLARRRAYGHRLVECFHRFPGVYKVQVIPENVNTNFQNLGVCCTRAADLGLAAVLALFKSRGVGVRSYFDPPLYRFSGFGPHAALPVTESVWQTLISFPIHSRMTEAVLSRIERAVAEVAEKLCSLP
jgi:perosamine synthetase